jgi:ABC-type branched-subunit amino acid transport system ATPase component/ABC-type branched-subunit amino acid transport system permease subunit
VYGLPLWAAAVVAVAAAVAAGVIAAIPAVRLGGLSLALATLALAFIFDDLVFELPSVQGPGGGGWGIPRPSFAISNSAYSLFLLGILVVLVLLVRNFQLSATGRSVLAVRGSRVGAAASGVSVQKAVIVTFGLSALIAGIGGFLYAQTFTQITSTSNPPLNALLWVTIAVSIGIRRPMGAIIAGLSSAILPQLLTYVTTSTEWPLLFWGVGAVVLAEFPEGTLDLHVRQLVKLRDRFVPAAVIRRGLDFYRLGPALAAAEAPGPALVTGAGRGVSLNGSASTATTRPSIPGANGDGREATDGELALATRQLRSGYGELEVLHGVDLSVRAGEITGVFGANGSGKSTLCSTLAGLIEITAGDIELEGQSIGRISGTDRARRGMFVVTESRSIFPNLTVEENLKIALRTPDAIGAALDQFAQLKARRLTRAGMLSGGEQQLLALAPALITTPRVLVADEPTLGLAPRASEQVLHVFQQLRDSGTAVLLIEERPRGVFAICDQVALLHLGHLAWQRPQHDVSADDLVESYLAAAKR